MKELTELVELAKKATSGKWIADSGEGWDAIISQQDMANANFIIGEFIGPDSKANKEFVSAANPETILAIAEAFRALEQRVEEAEKDKRRMDWLCAHCVEVRKPLMYGSHAMFHAQQDSEEWDLPHHTTLREQVDAAMRNIEEQSQ